MCVPSFVRIREKLYEKYSDLNEKINFTKNFKTKVSKIRSIVLCVLAHKTCVQSFVRIGEKL